MIDLGNIEYSFITITPMSILAQTGRVRSMDQIKLFAI